METLRTCSVVVFLLTIFRLAHTTPGAGITFYNNTTNVSERSVLNISGYDKTFSFSGDSVGVTLRCWDVNPVEWIWNAANSLGVFSKTNQTRWKEWTRNGENCAESFITFNVNFEYEHGTKTFEYKLLDFLCKTVNEPIEAGIHAGIQIFKDHNTNKIRVNNNPSRIRLFQNQSLLPNCASRVELIFDAQSGEMTVRLEPHTNEAAAIRFRCPWSAQQCGNTFRAKAGCLVSTDVVNLNTFCAKNNVVNLNTFCSKNTSALEKTGGVERWLSPGVVVVTGLELIGVAQYFFSYKHGIPKLEVSWSNIDPASDMIRFEPLFQSKEIYYVDSILQFRCQIPKYGFSYTPYFEATSAVQTIKKVLSDLVSSEEEAELFWMGDLSYTPTTPGSHKISCVARSWNTTTIWRETIEIFVLGREGRSTRFSPLQKLNQETKESDSMVFIGSSSSNQIVDVLKETERLLNQTLAGRKSVALIKDDVDAGIGVYVNIAKNNVQGRGKGALGPKLLNSIETTLEGFSEHLLSDTAKLNSTEVEFTNGMVGIRREDSQDIYYPRNYSQETTHIHVPKEWHVDAQNEPTTYVATVVPGVSFPNDFEAETLNTSSFTKKELNSDVVSFTFSVSRRKVNSTNVQKRSVQIVFEHKEQAQPECANDGVYDKHLKAHDGRIKLTKFRKGSGVCAYLNTTTMKWSTEGCRLTSSNVHSSICECDHLTAFALLMDPFETTGNEKGLEILTWVVCPLSIIGLCLTLVIFVTLRPKGNRTDIVINLSACLLFGKFCVLALLDRSYLGLSDGLCTFSAMLIHYIYLTSFAWMTTEGIQLYRLAIFVFAPARPYVTAQYAGAYCFPLVVVGITALTAYLNGEHAYGGDCFCWLVDSYSWSFFGPAALMLIVNFVVLVISVKVAIGIQNNKELQATKKVKPFLSWVRAIFGLTILLGLSWSVGFVMFSQEDTVYLISAYIFTLLNGLQGVFMFVFHVILNQQVRTVLKAKVEQFTGTTVSFSR